MKNFKNPREAQSYARIFGQRARVPGAARRWYVVDKDVDTNVVLVDPGAKTMWGAYLAFVTPSLGARDRWVPYHTVSGAHELSRCRSRVPQD